MEQGAKLYAAGQSAAAACLYRQAQQIAPQDPTVRLRLALAIWHGENRGEEALSEVRELASEHPQPQVLGAEAMILNSLGRFEEAADVARRALDMDPANPGAWVDLAAAAPADQASDLAQELSGVLDPKLRDPARRQLHLAHARLLRKSGEYDAAFDAMTASNALAPSRSQSDQEKAHRELLANIFTPDLMRRLAGEGLADGRMVFIIGMPRSGTTLLERLLTAHPQVATAGETTLVGTLFGQFTSQVGKDPVALQNALDGPTLRAMATAYLQGLAVRVRGQSDRVIDKMPANYLYAPLIRLMFPRAAILHMRRHPLDTCLSCWEAGFSFGLDYAARFDSLGTAYRAYADTVGRWFDLTGLRMQDVCYEDLVAAPEPVMRDVLMACGLPWDPACLSPATGGQIKTASVVQARGGVSTNSVGRWERYRDRLQPLIAALGGMDWINASHSGAIRAADHP